MLQVVARVDLTDFRAHVGQGYYCDRDTNRPVGLTVKRKVASSTIRARYSLILCLFVAEVSSRSRMLGTAVLPVRNDARLAQHTGTCKLPCEVLARL